ncbi:response regulator [Slackia isoflavoniconvertens]
MEAVAGSQALDKFTNAKPDLVILDIMMPGLDGSEVCGLGYRLGD